MISPFLFILYLNEFVRILRDNQCPSIWVDNDCFYFNMPMYADDMAICNDTAGRLQRSIDILGIFCDKYGLMVNMLKTNVIVFRNGVMLRQNEKKILQRRSNYMCHILQIFGHNVFLKAMLDTRQPNLSVTSR